MIFFYGEGRLGNQIFQYQALSQIAKPGERIFAVGLEDLQPSLDLFGAMLTVLTRSLVCKRIVKYGVNPLLRTLARELRLINHGFETQHGAAPNNGPSGELCIRRGLLKRITFVDGGFYQNAAYWPSFFPAPSFRIKPAVRDAARQHLKSACGDVGMLAFVHVRRGDYLKYTNYGLADLALPADFYRAAAKELEVRIGETHLVFVTDDPAWVKTNFSELTNKTIVATDFALDFAIMTQCAGGILSNSTFSLAAALLLSHPGIVIAPKYWFGFRVQAWYPPTIQFTHPSLIYLQAET
jgi:hypothetical protein